MMDPRTPSEVAIENLRDTIYDVLNDSHMSKQWSLRTEPQQINQIFIEEFDGENRAVITVEYI
jgi:hypothetical protein